MRWSAVPADFLKVNLALSLHSVRQGGGEWFIPRAAKFRLDDLRSAVAQVNEIQQSTVMVEYLMLAGVNDSPDDAPRAATLLGGLDVHVNLIPYNRIATVPISD